VTAEQKAKGRLRVFFEELIVDALITAAIVWAFVLLGTPLVDIITGPIFIVLVTGGLVYLIFKGIRRDPHPAE
jgi:hypothetical protein